MMNTPTLLEAATQTVADISALSSRVHAPDYDGRISDDLCDLAHYLEDAIDGAAPVEPDPLLATNALLSDLCKLEDHVERERMMAKSTNAHRWQGALLLIGHDLRSIIAGLRLSLDGERADDAAEETAPREDVSIAGETWQDAAQGVAV